MRQIPLTLYIVCHELENGTFTGRAVGYPTLAAFGAKRADVIQELTANAISILEEANPENIADRHAVSALEIHSFQVRLKPPRRNIGWQNDVKLTLNSVKWTIGKNRVAYVPVLDITVVATGSLSLSKLIEDHVRLILKRDSIDSKLENLVWIQRDVGVTIGEVDLQPHLLTAKEFAMREFDKKDEPVLPTVATSMVAIKSQMIVGMEQTVSHLADTLTAARPRSALLVGPGGVGKTAAYFALYQRRTENGLKEFQFFNTTGSRLVAGMTGFGAWQERCERVCAEAEPDKVILHLGNLAELNMVGRSVANDDGIAEFLAPYCQRGEIRAVVECTPEQANMLEESHPDLLSTFARINITEPDEDETYRILQQTVTSLQPRTNISVKDDSVRELLRLHNRYATYSTSPGRPLRFLKNLIQSAERNSEITVDDVTQSFATETGLPLFLLDDATPLNFDAMSEWFGRRVLGQSTAIDVVTNLIATVKAGLSRPDRPIASLLFVGPTGVGKTETAKALAEFLYHDPARMVRVDMSEYADSSSLDRLTGGIDGGEGVLTSRVREQPFGVVLLDEFEKAHPRFFDLLLQVLGEGRLTDSAGRVADFRNSVIIMTSNLGTEVFDQGVIGLGREESTTFHYDESYFVAEVQKVVRPEFFNRIDRVVPFIPLDAKALTLVARRELDLLSEREGLRYRKVEMEFNDAVLEEVVRQGYEPRYGARPIKRAIDRHVLAPLSIALNDHPANVHVRADVQFADNRLTAVARRVAQRNAEQKETLMTVISRLQSLRRQIARAVDCPKAQSIRNRIDRLEHESRRNEKRRGRKTLPSFDDVERSRELTSLRPLEEKILQLDNDVSELEVMVLPDVFNGMMIDEKMVGEETQLLQDDLHKWLEDIFLHGREGVKHALVVLHARNPANPLRMAQALIQVGRAAEESVEIFRVCPIPDDELQKARTREAERIRKRLNVAELPEDTNVPQPVYWCEKINDVELTSKSLTDNSQAIALVISSRLAWLRYEGEAGLHEFKSATTSEKVFVEVLTDDVTDYERVTLPLHDHKKLKGTAIRRYDERQRSIEDKMLKMTLQWPKKALESQLEEFIRRRFDNRLYRQINE